ncbi:unnamed protein product [Caretta caretta]
MFQRLVKQGIPPRFLASPSPSPSKMGLDEYFEAYVVTFEKVVTCSQREKESWGIHFSPVFRGKTQATWFANLLRVVENIACYLKYCGLAWSSYHMSGAIGLERVQPRKRKICWRNSVHFYMV